MKNEILEALSAVISTLNEIPVSGERDCGNMFGCLRTLKDIGAKIAGLELSEPTKEQGEAQ